MEQGPPKEFCSRSIRCNNATLPSMQTLFRGTPPWVNQIGFIVIQLFHSLFLMMICKYILDCHIPFHSSSRSTSRASGLAVTTGDSCIGFALLASSPLLAATKPKGARAWRSRAAMASACSLFSLSPSSVVVSSGCCRLRARA
jgi:hypothetical protein